MLSESKKGSVVHGSCSIYSLHLGRSSFCLILGDHTIARITHAVTWFHIAAARVRLMRRYTWRSRWRMLLWQPTFLGFTRALILTYQLNTDFESLILLLLDPCLDCLVTWLVILNQPGVAGKDVNSSLSYHLTSPWCGWNGVTPSFLTRGWLFSFGNTLRLDRSHSNSPLCGCTT